jgi:hypothetical protein
MHLNCQIADRRLRRIRGRARTVAENHRAAPRSTPTRVPPAPETPTDGQARSEGERRSVARVMLSSEVIVRRIGGFNFEVALSDVSTHGCRVQLLEPCQAGDLAITRFPRLEPLGSRVCWARGVTAGMQFHTSIHPAVFESLVARLSGDETAAA